MAATGPVHLIHPPATPSSPSPPVASPCTKQLRFPTPPEPPKEHVSLREMRRRGASLLFLSLAAALPASPLSATRPPAAAAFGISGPKEWLRDQKKKAAKYILAPIEASRRSLEAATPILASGSVSSAADVEQLQKLINAAARDCVPEERNSVVAFQARTGVEVCTFTLLVKNAASLLDDRDPVKLDTEAKLDKLVRSFTSLGRLLDVSNLELAFERKNAAAALKETMVALDNFEGAIKKCLGV